MSKKSYKKNGKVWKIVAIVLASVLVVGGCTALITNLVNNRSEYVDMEKVTVEGDSSVKNGVVTLKSIENDADSAVAFEYSVKKAGVYEVSFQTEAEDPFYHKLTNLTADKDYTAQNMDFNDSYDEDDYSTQKCYVYMNEGKNELVYTVSGSDVELSGICVKKYAEGADVILNDFEYVAKATVEEGAAAGYADEFGGACCLRYDGSVSDVARSTFSLTKGGTYKLDMIGAGVGSMIVIKSSEGDIAYIYYNNELLPTRMDEDSDDSETVGGEYATQYIDLGEVLTLGAGEYTVEITSTKDCAAVYAILLTDIG